jgi:high affinity Mn2+ porin
MMKYIMLFILLGAVLVSNCFAQAATDTTGNFSVHFQQTVINQLHPGFQASYTGPNSLHTEYESETSLTTTLFLGMRLAKSLELYFDPEVSGGSGISGAVGLAGFSNGETFRIGDPKPALYPARYFLKYTSDLGHVADDVVEDAPNQLAGKRSSECFTLILGKFGIADYFDNNEYSHDPRQQFLNWALMNSGAWDYPADTRGYTAGLIAIYTTPVYTLQFSAVLVPVRANGLLMDSRIGKAHGLALEYDRRYHLSEQPGEAGVLIFYNKARMGSYSETLETPSEGMDIVNSRRYSREKYGFALSVSQQLTDNSGCFLRASWNDGKTETWVFTEIDHSLALGYVARHLLTPRIGDEAGISEVINGISSDHRDYLANGGMGFMIGDGRLNYANECITEMYYKIPVNSFISLSVDYQFVQNPAYNRDRGPVNIFGVRVHTEF